MIIYNSQQEPVKLGSIINREEQFTAYTVVGQSTLSARIYNKPPNLTQHHKLDWMRANPPYNPKPSHQPYIAWPLDLLYTQQEQFIGYLTPHFQNAVPLSTILNPDDHQAQTFPRFNDRRLYHTARNLAAAIGALHARGYVIGDINDSNILVTPSAMVILTNTDSFQVKVQKTDQMVIYPCPPGKPEYTPPELQGKSSQNAFRQPEHDYFGLGALIFQLLMNGVHPYQVQWLSHVAAPSIPECIRLGYFPYNQSVQHLITPPQHAPSFDMLPVANLLRTCFVDGHHTPKLRPTPHLWEAALTKAEQILIKCRYGHYYSGHFSNCPHCNATRPSKPVVSPAGQKRRLTLPTGRISAAASGTKAANGKSGTIKPGQARSQPKPKATTAPAGKKRALNRRSSRVWAVAVFVVAIICSGAFLMINELVQFPTLAPSISLALPAKPAEVDLIEPVDSETAPPEDSSLPSSADASQAEPAPTQTPTTAPSPTPTATAIPPWDDIPPPVDTPQPPSEVAPLPPPPPTATGVAIPAGPESNIVMDLPGGDTYNYGELIEITGTIKDPDGVGTVYVWVTRAEAANRTLVAHNNHQCHNVSECIIADQFTNLLSGPYTIQILAQDSQGHSIQQEIPITIR